tara:strand:+ start:6927 stop:7262 length:336 start_codon:yes stop_codon:yes gene_type:complete
MFFVKVRAHCYPAKQWQGPFPCRSRKTSDYAWHDLPIEKWFWVAGPFDDGYLKMWFNYTRFQRKKSKLTLTENAFGAALSAGTKKALTAIIAIQCAALSFCWKSQVTRCTA